MFTPVILVLGMPGSGKTTVGRVLSKHLRMSHRSVGDILRSGRATGDCPPSGRDPATWFLEHELTGLGEEIAHGIILDFSPVSQDGVWQLHAMLHEKGSEIRGVVYVKTAMHIAEMRYCARGVRPGDASTSLKLLFEQRIAREFRPFTLPMIRVAHREGRLFVIDNSGGGPLQDESRLLKVVTILTTCIWR